MKTIAIGGFFHESNTFNPIICGADDFVIFRGQEAYTKSAQYPLAKGMLDYFEGKKGYQILPLIFARAVPNGEIDKTLYLRLKEEFFALIERPPDLFLLPLHGSMRVKDIGSAESDLLASIRSLYPSVPIICGLDLHATLTDEMLNFSQALVAFKTAPHIDAIETGQHAAQIAEAFLAGKTKPTQAACRLPILIAGEKSETASEPMQSLISRLSALEKEPQVLAASYLLGFPWADHAHNGVNALVVTDNDPTLAQKYAEQLAVEFLAAKDEFSFSMPAYPPSEALQIALKDTVKPVFISDSGDNPTAGSTADNTYIIRLLSGEFAKACLGKKILVAGIYDPQALQICRNNLNQNIDLTIGGVFDTKYSLPARLTGRAVKHLGNFGAYHSELILFKTANFDLIITSKHIGFTGVDIFKALEIDYLTCDIIIVKLGYLTPDFKAIAAKHYLALSPGCTDAVLRRLDYSHEYELL